MDRFDLKKWERFGRCRGLSPSNTIIDQIAIDSRLIASKDCLFVALEGLHSDGHQFVESALRRGAKFALVKRGFASSGLAGSISDKEHKLIEVDSPLSAFQEIAAIYRCEMKCKVVAITGAYGKTMLKDLLVDILSKRGRCVASPESFNSQIGVPLSLLQIRESDELALIEAAVSRPKEMESLAQMIAPSAVIFTPLGEKHLLSMGSEEIMQEEYFRLLVSKSVTDWLLVPSEMREDPRLNNRGVPIYFWDEDDGKRPFVKELATTAFGRQDFLLQFPDTPPIYRSVYGGFHYTKNLLNMALKAAHLLGADVNAIQEALENFSVEPNRVEIWKSPEGPTFVNEPYGQNPLSFEKAAKFIQETSPMQEKIFIFGGVKKPLDNEEGALRAIAKSFARLHPKTVIAYGDSPLFGFFEEFRLHSPATELSHEKGLREALRRYRKECSPNEIALVKGAKKESLETLFQEFNDSISVNQCVINLAAIKSNLDTLRKKLPKATRLMVMVKAMAYGTGDVRMSHFLKEAGVDILGVSYVDEGVALKRAGVTQAIFAIDAAPFEAAKVVKWGLEVGVSTSEMIEALEHQASLAEKRVKLHLHIDTGMGRLGARPEKGLELIKQIVRADWLDLEGIMTHFPAADDPKQDSFTISQIKKVEEIVEQAKSEGIDIPFRHCANSSGAIRLTMPICNMVRIGLAAYGLYGSDAVKKELTLRPAVSLITRIVGINQCFKGETISYGRSFEVTRDKMRIAVLPLGYFDGLHRSYSGKSDVIVRGKKAPMVGTICMDFMMIDITDIEEARVGDRVLVFGEDEMGHYIAPEELAEKGGSIAHELITCLGPRIQRVFVYEEKEKRNYLPL